MDHRRVTGNNPGLLEGDLAINIRGTGMAVLTCHDIKGQGIPPIYAKDGASYKLTHSQ